ncbi:MAG: glycosyl hydrolase [Clostridia bacterium]|nr:glycosyl hydrolase [Clostridia bacterium]
MIPVASTPQPRPSPSVWPLLTGVAAALILVIGIAWFLPGFTTVSPDTAGEPQLIWQGQIIDGTAVIRQEDRFYFHVPVLQSLLDPNIFWDAENGYLAVTTKDRLIQMDTSQLTWYINQEPVELRFPLLMVDGEPYVELEPLQFLYRLDINYISDTNRLLVREAGSPLITGEVFRNNSHLRLAPSVRAPRLAKLQQGGQLVLIEEEANWFKVQTGQGLIGFLPEKHVALQTLAWSPSPGSLEKPAWKPLGQKINLVWEQVTGPFRNPKSQVLSRLLGVNVYSPTWFHLNDAEGNLISYADSGLVKTAHQEGKQVWALFSNSFDPEMTAEFLQNPEARNRTIRQLAIQANLYNLDGINIDFENISPENKELLVQFVRELAPVLREQGLVISIDVTFKSDSGYWSLIYDRAALGQAVDYVMVMAYDEHWATSPIPGSVASLPWVEKGLQEILKEVPADKVILGLPLYARLWTVSQEGVTSKAWSMNQTKKWLQDNRLEPEFDPHTGQYFAELEDADQRYLLWLEDETSLQQRVELVHEYGLAGVAAWQRGFAKDEIWPALSGYLGNTP